MNPCPRCHTALSPQQEGDITLENCERCHGQWLEPDDLKAIIEATVFLEMGPGVRTGIDLTDVQEDAPCPRCGVLMQPFNYAGDSGVILDKCPNCGGLWLDAGDLERVLAVVAASEQGLGRDIKRFSADLHEAEVRQDAQEQRDGRPVTDPLSASIANSIADADPRP
jgi:Zn-finger nucleic acid-binding protein